MKAAPLLAFVVALASVRLLLATRFREIAVDRPNERSLHTRIIPRTGGLAILAGTTAGVALCHDHTTQIAWLIALALGVVSFVDDRRGLPILLRLFAQLAASGTAVFTLELTRSFWLGALAVLTFVWMINLYNFMDGSNGLAGGMGVSGFMTLALGAIGTSAPALCALAASLAVSCLAFLTHNLTPARIFMGDAGSTVLGYAATAVGLLGVHHGLWPLWFPPLAFLPFWADATVTITRRALRRERIWTPHREHYYQRLIRSGWTHMQVALAEWVLMLACGASGLFALRSQGALGWFVLGAWCVVIAIAMALVDMRWRRWLLAQGPGAAAQSTRTSSPRQPS